MEHPLKSYLYKFAKMNNFLLLYRFVKIKTSRLQDFKTFIVIEQCQVIVKVSSTKVQSIKYKMCKVQSVSYKNRAREQGGGGYIYTGIINNKNTTLSSQPIMSVCQTIVALQCKSSGSFGKLSNKFIHIYAFCYGFFVSQNH